VAHLDERSAGVPRVEIEQAELDARPGGRLALPDRGRRCEPHRPLRPVRVAEQLAGVRDPGVGSDVRLDRVHPVEGRERLPVAAELERRVADHAVDARGRGRDPLRPQPERERRPEAVARERELPEPRRRDQVARGGAQRQVEDAVGLAVVRRVAGLPHALEIGEAERGERLHIRGVGLQLRLQAGDLRLGVAGGEALLQLGGDGRRQRVRRGRDAVVTEHAAEGEGGGDRSRRRPSDQEPSPHQPVCGKGWPLVLSKPLNGAATYGKVLR
jgi:hypothetical protein